METILAKAPWVTISLGTQNSLRILDWILNWIDKTIFKVLNLVFLLDHSSQWLYQRAARKCWLFLLGLPGICKKQFFDEQLYFHLWTASKEEDLWVRYFMQSINVTGSQCQHRQPSVRARALFFLSVLRSPSFTTSFDPLPFRVNDPQMSTCFPHLSSMGLKISPTDYLASPFGYPKGYTQTQCVQRTWSSIPNERFILYIQFYWIVASFVWLLKSDTPVSQARFSFKSRWLNPWNSTYINPLSMHILLDLFPAYFMQINCSPSPSPHPSPG